MNIKIKEALKSLKMNTFGVFANAGMTNRERELRQEIADLKESAKALMDEGKHKEARAKLDDAKAKKSELDNFLALQKDFEAITVPDPQNKGRMIEEKKEKTNEEIQTFINHVRTKFKNVMTSSNEDGGYTVPEDIQTKINEYRESKDALQNLISVENVSAPTGARTFKARAQQTGFVEVDELGDIPEKATPKFTRLSYAVKKYAGFLTSSNELLKDSDEAIRSVIERWIGDESRITRNKKILEVLTSKDAVEINGADGIKKVLNVDLDPAFRYTSVIVTNQDGFNYLDTLKDETGNYLLQPSVSSPTGKQIFGVDVAIVSNKDLPTVENNAPIFIGDLKEAVVLFNREGTEVKASDVAGDAYLTDATLFRAIERFDVKMRDAEAYVYGTIDVTPEV